MEQPCRYVKLQVTWEISVSATIASHKHNMNVILFPGTGSSIFASEWPQKQFLISHFIQFFSKAVRWNPQHETGLIIFYCGTVRGGGCLVAVAYKLAACTKSPSFYFQWLLVFYIILLRLITPICLYCVVLKLCIFNPFRVFSLRRFAKNLHPGFIRYAKPGWLIHRYLIGWLVGVHMGDWLVGWLVSV